MKKRDIVLAVIGVTIGVAWILCRITGALQVFSTSTNSNYPTIVSGDKIFASNLVEPKKLDFICFKKSMDNDQSTYVHRLCGIGGDCVEIKNGILFINGQNYDEKLSVSHYYKVASNDFSNPGGKIEAERIMEMSSDTIIVLFEDHDENIKKMHAVRTIEPIGSMNTEIKSVYDFEWSLDNFGPLTIPENKYFVLGDSRHNSLDSRFIGLIDKSDFVGTVLGKH